MWKPQVSRNRVAIPVAAACALLSVGCGENNPLSRLHGTSNAGSETVAGFNLQGDQAAWMANPNMKRFYQAAIEAFAEGPDKVDAAAFDVTSYAIFRDFARDMGVQPDAMVDHLKAIPRQMVEIAREDPSVLDSYDAFQVALMGPS
jgi:hypothetical protein